MTPEEMYQQYLQWSQAGEQKPQDTPPEPAEAVNDALLYKPGAVPEIAAAAPKALVRYYTEPGRAKSIIDGISMDLGHWLKYYMDEKVMAFGESEKTLTRIGTDTAQYESFTRKLADNGLRLNLDHMSFIKALSKKMSNELGNNWRGRISPPEEDSLLSAAALQVAVANATVPKANKDEYQSAIWSDLHRRILSGAPEYWGTPVQLRREIGEIEDYLDGWTAPTPERQATARKWYILVSGNPAPPTPADLIRELKATVDKVHTWHAQSTEAQKWSRLGIAVDPANIDPKAPEIPLTQAPFAHDAIASFAVAQSRRLSWADPYGQSLYNTHEDMRETLAKRPEEILGPMWRFVDNESLGAPVPLGMVSGGGRTRRSAWTEADKDIRATEDPAQRYEKMLNVLGSEAVNDQMRAYWNNEISRRSTEDVARQRAEILEFESHKDGWRADVHRAVEDNSRAQQAERAIEQERLEKTMADSPLFHAVTWTMTAAANISDALGARALGEMFVHPVSDVILDRKYAGLAPAEVEQINKAGSLGQLLSRKLGTENLSENWLKYYTTKVSTKQAGWTDHAFFTGAMLTAGLLEMPSMALDSPFEFAAIGKLLGGWHKATGKIGESMSKAGVPTPLVGAMHLASNPMNVGRAIVAFLGRTPQVVRTLGVGENRFRKELANATPEYRQAALQWAQESFKNARAAGILTDSNKADMALTTYASILARADENQRITPRQITDFSQQLRDMPLAFTRRVFAPFVRHGASYDRVYSALTAQAENASLIEAEESIVSMLDTEFQKNPIGITPSYLFKNAYNAFYEGKLNKWKEWFGSKVGSLVPRPLAEAVLNHVDKRIQVGSSLPYHEAVVWAAARRLREQEATAKSMSSVLNFLAQRTSMELATTAQHEIALSANINATQKSGAVELAREMMVEAGELQSRRKMLQLMQNANETDLARLMKRLSVRMTYLTEGPELQPKDLSSYEGLEIGLRSTMTRDMKTLASKWLLELALTAPEELGRHGLSESIHTAVTEAAKLWKGGEEGIQKSNRALKLARASVLKDDFRQAQTILRGAGVMVKPTKDAVLEGLETLSTRMASAEQKLTHRVSASLSKKLSGENAWDIPELDADLSDAINTVRRHIEDNEALRTGRPAATVADYLIDPMFVTAGRMSGLIAQQAETGARSVLALVERMRDDADTLSITERRRLSEVQSLHPSKWPDDLPVKIQQLAQREWDTRMQLINMASDVGAISKEDATRMASHGYSDRYYVSHSYMRELVESGRTLYPEGLSKTLRLATSAPLQRFKTAASPHYARVFYRDWGSDGMWREYVSPVTENISPSKATKIAQNFIDDLVAKKKLGPGEYSAVVPALTDKIMAKKGAVDSNLDLRYSTLMHLATEVARRQMFTQFAKMSHLVRDKLGDNVPTNQQREWVFVDGPEWGPLSGRYVHKNLIGQINSWTGFNQILKAITEDVQNSLTAMGHEKLVGKIQVDGFLDKSLNWVDTLVRHNRIMWNIRSWANNNLGNIMSAMASGVNTLRPRYWKYFQEYDKLRGNLEETELASIIQREAGEPGVDAEFMDTAWYGMWQKPVDMPEYMSQGFKGFAAKERSEMYRLITQTEDFEQAAQRLEHYLENAELPAEEHAQYRRIADSFWDQAHEVGYKMLKRAVKNGTLEAILTGGTPTPAKGKLKMAAEEVVRFAGNPSASEVRRWVAEAYGAVDAKHKWATYRCLREDGYSVEAATEAICHNFQNFAALHPLVRGLRDRKVLGAFVPGFPAEAARTGANIMQNNPIPFINFFAGVAAWNFGVLFAKGMAPSDAFQMGGDDSTMDYLKRLFLTVHVPTSNGFTSLDLTQMGPWAAFAQPSGGLSPVIKSATEYIDDKAGIFGLPVSLLANWVSNFVVNTPLSGSMVRYGVGVDTFSQELVFRPNGFGETVGNMLGEIGSYWLPGSALNAMEGWKEHRRGPISLITRYYPELWSRLTRGLSGQNIRQLDRKRAMANILLRFGGKELAQKMYAEGLDIDKKEYKAAVFRLQEAKTDEETQAAFAEAKEVLKKFSKQTGQIAGQKVEWSMNDDQLAEKIIRDAGQNILSVIRKIPTDRAVEAARQLGAGIGKSDDAEMVYLWRTLQDPSYMSSKDEVGTLMDALLKSLTYEREISDPDLRSNFSKTSVNLVRRLVTLRHNAVTRKPVNLMKEKIDTWPKHLLEANIDRLGLR